MSKESLIANVKKMEWEKWLERPFHAFVFSLFEDSSRKESFEKLGVAGVELRTQFGQTGSWYLNTYLMEVMDKQVEKYLENHTMFDITDSLEKFRNENKQKIDLLINSDEDVVKKFAEVFEMLKLACTHIWLAHGLESYYNRIIDQEVPKYIKNDIDTFVRAASFPKKKNAHGKLDEMLRNGNSDEEIVQTLGWLKIRDGFAEPFTVKEIAKMREDLAPEQELAKLEIPKELIELFKEVQELVFYRTERTDTFNELFYKARPIIQKLAEKFNIPWEDMKYYRAKAFLDGRVEKYQEKPTFVYLDGEVLFQNEPILTDQKTKQVSEFKGAIAYRGVIKGVVKVVKHVSELGKVAVGDILVTQMTFPSFISAMYKAAAFVTDEGGITCHAAIVSRELKKPCIVGTKIATQVLKDGDMVEVDADKGVVKVIKKI